MVKLVIRKGEVSINEKGEVVIKNDGLKKRVHNFINDPKAMEAHEAGLFDNCDCKCKPTD